LIPDFQNQGWHRDKSHPNTSQILAEEFALSAKVKGRRKAGTKQIKLVAWKKPSLKLLELIAALGPFFQPSKWQVWYRPSS
jgi:hypothetical protein